MTRILTCFGAGGRVPIQSAVPQDRETRDWTSVTVLSFMPMISHIIKVLAGETDSAPAKHRLATVLVLTE